MGSRDFKLARLIRRPIDVAPPPPLPLSSTCLHVTSPCSSPLTFAQTTLIERSGRAKTRSRVGEILGPALVVQLNCDHDDNDFCNDCKLFLIRVAIELVCVTSKRGSC